MDDFTEVQQVEVKKAITGKYLRNPEGLRPLHPSLIVPILCELYSYTYIYGAELHKIECLN